MTRRYSPHRFDRLWMMLQMAAIGVHMGNAVELARAAADVGTTSNDEDGVALAIEQHVLNPRGLTLQDSVNHSKLSV